MPRKKKPAPPRALYELRVSLDDVTPTVWRRFRIPADATLHDLHLVLQLVMGWTTTHLYEFRHGDDRYAEPDPDGDFDDDSTDTDDVRLGNLLRQPKDRIAYTYDFGDDWHHTVTLLAIHPDDRTHPETWCLDGAGACPPEDCGGPGGYRDLRHILANPKHPDHRDRLDWLELNTAADFDPAAFTPDDANDELADGLEGVRALFDDWLDEDDEDDEKPATNIIPFPKRAP
jgi:hypothetical protein